jgi:biopolymer transport protein ExbB/TolQ
MPHLSIDWMLNAIETLLYSVSTMLYLPVLLALAGLALYLLVCLGGFAGEWVERRRGIRSLVVAAEAQMAAVVAASDAQPALDARLECIVQKADADGLRRLDTVRFAVRVGPALGLMGTLIPMGISLAGLAQGNLPKMAESMTTAFTATVVGLACSVTAYLLTLAREHWLRTDMTEIAYAAETLLQRHAPAATTAARAGS